MTSASSILLAFSVGVLAFFQGRLATPPCDFDLPPLSFLRRRVVFQFERRRQAIGENTQARMGGDKVRRALHAQKWPCQLQGNCGAFRLFEAGGQDLGDQS